jgi:hypothetical protein
MTKLLVTLLFAVLYFTQNSIPAAAADVSAGVGFWYADWKVKSESTSRTFDYGSELMYGPVASVKLTDDFSFAGSFLVSNKYTAETDGKKYRRSDSDLTLNYSLNSYFKIFGGSKFMQFTGDNMYNRVIGPGIGAGFIFPLVGNLFLIGNGSYSYLGYGRYKYGSTVKEIKEYGYNMNGGIAYYLAAASLTINFGYRYQYYTAKVEKVSSKSDFIFKGATASIVYSF